MESDFPKEQRERVQPIVDSLLRELRTRTRTLPSQTPLALVYVPESPETSEPKAAQ